MQIIPLIPYTLYSAGPIGSCSRDMAMASWFVEGSRSVAISQLDSDSDGILPWWQLSFNCFKGSPVFCFCNWRSRYILNPRYVYQEKLLFWLMVFELVVELLLFWTCKTTSFLQDVKCPRFLLAPSLRHTIVLRLAIILSLNFPLLFTFFFFPSILWCWVLDTSLHLSLESCVIFLFGISIDFSLENCGFFGWSYFINFPPN